MPAKPKDLGRCEVISGEWVIDKNAIFRVKTGQLYVDVGVAQEIERRLNRPAEPDLAAQVEKISIARDKAIEQITAQLVHGEVTNEGWQLTLDELVAAQQNSKAG